MRCHRGSELDWLLADLEAAESLRAALPSASKDGRLIDATIGHLNVRLGELMGWDGARVDGADAVMEEKQEVPGVADSRGNGVPDVVRRLAEWRGSERAIDTADNAVASATAAAEFAERAAVLAERVAESAIRALTQARDTSDHAGETADVLRRDAAAAAGAASSALAAAEDARAHAAEARAAFQAAQAQAFGPAERPTITRP